MHRIFIPLMLLALLILLAVSALIGYNNRDLDRPGADQIESALQRGLLWLSGNTRAWSLDADPMLWHALQRIEELNPQVDLTVLLTQYRQNALSAAAHDPRNALYPWLPLFDRQTPVRVLRELQTGEAVNETMHLLYAINCSAEQPDNFALRARNEATFCGSHHLFKPECAVRQMMAIRLLQKRSCGTRARLSAAVDSLQHMLVDELTLDPRMLDIYILRALMLVDSGAGQWIKPVWLQRILHAQGVDGGWSDFQPLLAMGGGRFLGFVGADDGHGGGFAVQAPVSELRPTVHAVLLLSLLQQPID